MLSPCSQGPAGCRVVLLLLLLVFNYTALQQLIQIIAMRRPILCRVGR